MVTLPNLWSAFADHPLRQYQCQANLNLYDSPQLSALATQAVMGRQFRVRSLLPVDQPIAASGAVAVQLCEDDYPGWIAIEDLDLVDVAEAPYQPIVRSESEIRDRLPQVIAYAMAAMSQPNYYLWGGTVGPNYDCSGLVQAAFTAAGVWLPRDAYQQAAFTQPQAVDRLQPGDLLFFGTATPSPQGRTITHVGIALGDDRYIHSSGKDQGRNGIAIDRLSDADAISAAYYRQFKGAGRVTQSYLPQAPA